ncbi:MAG: HAD hydrolase-like protein [Bacteroidales bacterium]|nr:HAD hydrolase-like protein [Bacteroidales bacterium]
MIENIKTIAFDADDTLWVNETYYRETERKFEELLQDYLPPQSVTKILLQTEIKNLPLYGYGVKGFVLSMIETMIKISNKQANLQLVEKIIELGKELINKPIILLDGVEEILQKLNGNYRLVLATKGDLLDQERKLIKSGLEKHFHHIEIMSDKKVSDYQKLVKHLDCKAAHFLMIGNSLKSDIIPVLEIGGHAIHVPYHTTWLHEMVDGDIDNPNFYEVEGILEIINLL